VYGFERGLTVQPYERERERCRGPQVEFGAFSKIVWKRGVSKLAGEFLLFSSLHPSLFLTKLV